MTTKDSVTLYKTEPIDKKYWLTTASLDEGNNISIISGDAHVEWFINWNIPVSDPAHNDILKPVREMPE